MSTWSTQLRRHAWGWKPLRNCNLIGLFWSFCQITNGWMDGWILDTWDLLLQFSPFASEVAHVAEAAEVCLQEAGLVAGRGAAVLMLMEKTVRNHNLYIPANCFCTISWPCQRWHHALHCQIQVFRLEKIRSPTITPIVSRNWGIGFQANVFPTTSH